MRSVAERSFRRPRYPAVALTSVFFCIARNPQTWNKIREEIKGLEDEDLTLGRLKTLHYVQNVIKEDKHTVYNPSINVSLSC